MSSFLFMLIAWMDEVEWKTMLNVASGGKFL